MPVSDGVAHRCIMFAYISAEHAWTGRAYVQGSLVPCCLPGGARGEVEESAQAIAMLVRVWKEVFSPWRKPGDKPRELQSI